MITYLRISFFNIIRYAKLIIDIRELTISFFFLFFGLCFLFIELFPDKFDSEDDFTQFKANLYSNDYITYSGGRGPNKHQYQITLYGYNDIFIISNSLIDYFDRDNFEIFVKSKSPVFIDIEKNDIKKLNTHSNILI